MVVNLFFRGESEKGATEGKNLQTAINSNKIKVDENK